MKNTSKFFTLLALWIVLLFSAAITGTFLHDYLDSFNFFGDYPHTYVDFANVLRTEEKWGTRHFWWGFMCAALFILSVVRICVWGNKFIETNTPK